jgi:hypothetical protein
MLNRSNLLCVSYLNMNPLSRLFPTMNGIEIREWISEDRTALMKRVLGCMAIVLAI